MAENTEKSKSTVNEEMQYFTFLLKDKLFSFEVTPIKEIIEYLHITKVPMMQRYILGVTNVRGEVLPVVDLSDRIGLGENIQDRKTCIVIVEIENNGEKMNVGMLIDAINQVLTVTQENLEDAPEFGLKIDKRFVKKMMKSDKGFIEILNLDTILSLSELSTILV
jgi:purine-binding chemotaxis protein CheW